MFQFTFYVLVSIDIVGLISTDNFKIIEPLVLAIKKKETDRPPKQLFERFLKFKNFNF